jgi:DNA-binding response OmpR family regulator
MTKTILIVEDDPFIAMDLQDTFEDAGYRVLGPVASVDPGLRLLSEAKPDVAMLDYNLGRETSIPIAYKLDEAAVPYIFLSGQVGKVVTASHVSSHEVMMKPFNADRLIARIDQLARTNSVAAE